MMGGAQPNNGPITRTLTQRTRRPRRWRLRRSDLLLRFLVAIIAGVSLLSFHLASVHIGSVSVSVPGGGDKEKLFMSSSGRAPNDAGEATVLRSVMKRVQSSRSECEASGADRYGAHNQQNSYPRQEPSADVINATGASLKWAGVAGAIRKWMTAAGAKSLPSASCKMPPPKSCHVETFTIVVMSHNTGRFSKLMPALAKVFPRFEGLTEIVLVWNAPRESLISAANGSNNTISRQVARMLEWDANATHPFRIFYAIDAGLANDLLNRYHPLIAPINEALVYFDDDGPFYTTSNETLRSGLELWKRHSNLQVGTYGRHLSFHTTRIKHRLGIVHNSDAWLKQVTRNDNNFVPLCQDDKASYRYDDFSDFGSSLVLPTGSIIHKDYLCWLFHPAWEEIRDFVSKHITHPDDMFVTIIIAHLSGRGPKLYPRKEFISKGRRSIVMLGNSTTTNNSTGYNSTAKADSNHRRLMWEMPNWFDYRSDAMNQILTYFGSIHPGTLGWCAGSEYMTRNPLYPSNSSVPHVCNISFPPVMLAPWMNERGAGYHKCSDS